MLWTEVHPSFAQRIRSRSHQVLEKQMNILERWWTERELDTSKVPPGVLSRGNNPPRLYTFYKDTRTQRHSEQPLHNRSSITWCKMRLFSIFQLPRESLSWLQVLFVLIFFQFLLNCCFTVLKIFFSWFLFSYFKSRQTFSNQVRVVFFF